MDYINKILCGNDLEILPKLPAESVNCVVTSPPYWGLRDYGVEPVIWDGDKDCKHIWKKEITKRPNASGGKTDWAKEKLAIKGVENYQEFVDYHKRETKSDFCLKCNAWRGSLGLEPNFELYIKHLCDIFDEVKRVLRKDGTCWVNLGDSYGGSGNRSGHTLETSNLNRLTIGYGATEGNVKSTRGYEKSLLDIPYRFSIEMTNRGWTKRNTIIWWKPNCMPSSANDRFTIDFEYLFFFTKNNKTLFWTNEKTLECVDKKPLGIKGTEGIDWEWKEVGAINNITPNQRVRDIGKGTLERATEEEIENYGKAKWKKSSLWTGHDYWFEQQFENYDKPLNRWGGPKIRNSSHKYIEIGEPKLGKFGATSMFRKGRPVRPNDTGRNKRAVWIIPTQPFPEAHFAVYPEGLIEIPIKAGCPEFICKKCGKARVKIYKYKGGTIGKSWHDHSKDLEKGMHQSLGGLDKQGDKPYQRVDKGYSDCGCNAGFEGGIVLDPFMGAGTTALVALKQRKRFIGIEIKQEYIDMAKKRIAKVQQRIF